jgi:hypothetical protein
MPSKEQQGSKQKQEKQKRRSNLNVAERKKVRHPVMWILSVLVLILVAVAFLAGPIAGTAVRRGDLVFGYYNGEAIEYKPDTYFARQRDYFAEQVQQQGESENVQMQALRVWKNAFDQTVVHTAILQQADRSGFHLSEQYIDETLTERGPYVRNGEFDAEAYQETSQSERHNIRSMFRENLIHERWLQDHQNIPGSALEKEFVVGMASPERRFSYTMYNLDEYPAEEVRAYASENMKEFREINLSRINLRMEENEARQIYSQLREESGRFEELARNYSSGSYAEKGGDMGWVKYHELAGDFEDNTKADTIFALNQGETTELFETSFGYAIYRCDEPARDPDLESTDVIDSIRSYLIRNEKGRVEDYFIDRAEELADAARENGSLADAAGQYDRELQETDFFPINYGNAMFLKPIRSAQGESSPLSRAGSNQRILTKLFSLGENEYSEPLIMGNSVVVASLIEERRAPEEITNRLNSYYSYITRNYLQQEVRRVFLQSDKLEDNFMETFSRHFMQRDGGSQ